MQVLLVRSFRPATSFGDGEWTAGWGGVVIGAVLGGLLDVSHFHMVCAGCIALWLSLWVVSGIGFAGRLSVDCYAFC